jgi:hypothetical protein
VRNYAGLAELFPDFLSPFFNFRSCLSGLQWIHDFFSRWAVMQHLCEHSFPSRDAFSQQVFFCTSLSAALTRAGHKVQNHNKLSRRIECFILGGTRRIFGRSTPISIQTITSFAELVKKFTNSTCLQFRACLGCRRKVIPNFAQPYESQDRARL